METPRHVAWFSCGAASAVASYLATKLWDNTEVVYCDTMSAEHPDNQRFFDDIQEWIGQPITRIKSEKFNTVEEVWDKRQYMAGIAGAPCTVEMKKLPRYAFQREDDVHIFGYTADEGPRIKRFEDNNPELDLVWVLRDACLDKEDCYSLLRESGIRLPTMYGLGYRNNNCLGCVKATSTKYWNMIRRDFPEVFDARAKQSREIGARLTRIKGKRIFLDELPADYDDGRIENISCGPECGPPPNEDVAA